VTCNLEEREYRVYGYKGKQVRDNIHAEDVARFIFEFFSSPRVAEVYNIGGGKANSCSIIEAFALIAAHTGKRNAIRTSTTRAQAITSVITVTCGR
jgi:CDP-paratose 2-epimerase